MSGIDFPIEAPPATPVAPPHVSWRDVIFRRDAISWSMYDFANTIFSMNIISLYMKPWIVEDLGRDGFTFDFTVAMSMLAVALVSPALGVWSDRGARNKGLLFVFTAGASLALVALAKTPVQHFALLLMFFGAANFFYEGGMVFYNTLLYSVARDDRQARYLSGVGTALGYVGAIVGILLIMPFVTGAFLGAQATFITPSGAHGSFLPTAALYFLFATPLFFFVRERKRAARATPSFRVAYADVWRALRDSERYPGVGRFMFVDFCVKNAMNAVILNIGVFCLYVIGMSEVERASFLTVVTGAAVIGSFVVGRIAVGASLRRMIGIVACGWMITLALLGVAQSRWEFWVLSAAAGVLLGAVWTLHRPYLAEIAPRDAVGRMFGLNSLTGKAAAIVGPLWWGGAFWLCRADGPVGSVISAALQLDEAARIALPYRGAAASLTILVLCGVLALRGLPDARAGEEAFT